MVNGGKHVVVLKGYKFKNGKLMLNIRDSAKDPSSSNDIWIEKNTSPGNQVNLATDMCIYLTIN